MTDEDLIVLPGIADRATPYGRFWYTATHKFIASITEAGHGYRIAIVSISRRDAGPVTGEDRDVLRAAAARLDWQEEPSENAAANRADLEAQGVRCVPNYKLMCVLVPSAVAAS